MNRSRKYLLILLLAAVFIPLCIVQYLTNRESLVALQRVLCEANSSRVVCNSFFDSNDTDAVKENDATYSSRVFTSSNAIAASNVTNEADYSYVHVPYKEQIPNLMDEYYFAGNQVPSLFSNEASPNDLPPYKFTIIDWTMYLSNTNWMSIVSGNCLVTRNKTLAPYSDVIAIVSRKLSSLSALPQDRKPWQRWVWILDESPFHPVDGQPFELDNLRDIFNWTMTYRSDSDVYIPYGYTFKLMNSRVVDDSLFDNKSQVAAAVISNCNPTYNHNGRFRYIKQLATSMPVTIYGSCGIPCEGRINDQIVSHCQEIEKFKFFLAFENSNCNEYVTEKLFIHGLCVGAIPVVMGARKADYIKLAPPNSIIFAGDFAQPQDLAKYLVNLARNKTEYMKFHDWRRHYDVKYRLQYYDDLIWAPLCQKLNAVANAFRIQTDRYPDLKNFWNLNRDCDLSQEKTVLADLPLKSGMTVSRVIPWVHYQELSPQGLQFDIAQDHCRGRFEKLCQGAVKIQ